MRDYNNGVTPRARSHPKKCEESPQTLRGVNPVSGGMAPNQFFYNNSISYVIKLRVLAVHEGLMAHGTLPTLKILPPSVFMLS